MNGVNWSLNGKITSDLLKCIFSYIVNGFVAQNDERHFFAIQCKVEITFSPENWATIAGSILRGYANSRLCKHPNVVWLNFAPSCKPHGQKCILVALLKKMYLISITKKMLQKKKKRKKHCFSQGMICCCWLLALLCCLPQAFIFTTRKGYDRKMISF